MRDSPANEDAVNRLTTTLCSFDAFANDPARAALPPMLADADWPLAPELAVLARCIIEGQAPDAANDLLETLAGEAQDYLDYCQFRDREKLRGSIDERHAAWEAACLAQACAILQRQNYREGGYAPARTFDEPLRVI